MADVSLQIPAEASNVLIIKSALSVFAEASIKAHIVSSALLEPCASMEVATPIISLHPVMLIADLPVFVTLLQRSVRAIKCPVEMINFYFIKTTCYLNYYLL